jgi:hypothetical protein
MTDILSNVKKIIYNISNIKITSKDKEDILDLANTLAKKTTSEANRYELCVIEKLLKRNRISESIELTAFTKYNIIPTKAYLTCFNGW